MLSFLSDLRHAVRSSRRSPGFVLLVVLTLAVGIGVNVGMFSVVDAVLFSPLPYPDADRMVMIWNRHVSTGTDKVLISGPDLADYREQSTALEDLIFIHNATDNTLTDGQRAEQVEVAYVSSNLFQFLGVSPVAGRVFTADDERALVAQMGRPGPAVISHALWASRYGSDPDVLGRTIYLGGQPVEVVGVLPADFELVLPYREGGAMSSGANDEADVWRILPDRSFPSMPRSVAIVRVVARMREGVTLQQAQAEFDAIAARIRGQYRVHQERGTEIDLIPLHEDVVGPVRATILALFAAVAVLLVLACANVANLVSVRSAHRQREVAIRAAVGASRGRLIRQLLTENAVLAAAGAALGVPLAALLIDGIVTLAPTNVPMLDRVDVDGRALAFAIAAGFLATILSGVLPALRASSRAASRHLGSAGRPGLGRGHRLRAAIVTGEIALSVVLLVGGGLLVKSFVHLQRAQLGFEPDRVLSARVAIGHGAYDDESLRRQYWESLRRNAEAIPGVVRVGLVSPLPFGGQGAEIPYNNLGGEAADWGRYVASTAYASPGYFEVMGAEVLDGRTFQESDLDRTDIAVIDDIAAARVFPDGRAVGRQVWVQNLGQDTRRPLEVIGVVRHLRHSNVTGDEREVLYRPANALRSMAIVVQTAGDPLAVITSLQELAGSLDRDIPMFEVRTLASYIADRNATTRFTMTLASVFGLVALLMAAIGLYGVVAFAVEQRTSEIGLRMALGATPPRIIRQVLTEGGVMAGIGMAIGLVAALAVSRTIEGLLVGVPARDPATFMLVSAALLVAALLAAWMPARRASRLDPLVTLREE